MCSEVKHLKWRMGEASEQLQTPDFYRYGFKTSDLMDCAELFSFLGKQHISMYLEILKHDMDILH